MTFVKRIINNLIDNELKFYAHSAGRHSQRTGESHVSQADGQVGQVGQVGHFEIQWLMAVDKNSSLQAILMTRPWA